MDHAGSPAARDEFTRLDRAECLRLLAGVPVGRLIFTINALPVVRPMNFVLADGLIVLRTATGTTVARGPCWPGVGFTLGTAVPGVVGSFPYKSPGLRVSSRPWRIANSVAVERVDAPVLV